MLYAKLISFRHGIWLLGGSAVALALTACGGGGGGGAAEGTLKLAMTDSPGCGYDHVYVTVSKVRIHASSSASDSDSGWREMVVSPQQRIDLLGLTNGALQELGSLPLPAGRYEQVRLVLAGNPLDNALVLSSNPSTEIALTPPAASKVATNCRPVLTCKAARWPTWCWTLTPASRLCGRATPATTTSNLLSR